MKYQNVLNKALVGNYAIPHFNLNNMETAKWILEVCEEENSPVFISTSMNIVNFFGGFDIVRSMISAMIKDLRISVPVILHLDHGKSEEQCLNAYKAGYDSIMFDGSALELSENAKILKRIIKKCPKALVEGEIGVIGDASTTSIENVRLFLKEVKPNMLAVAVGTVHGFYKEKPNLNYDLIKEIHDEYHLPLVLHGGSGLSNSEIEKTIISGEVKINFNTDMQFAWKESIYEYLNNNKDVYNMRLIISSTENAYKKVLRDKIKILKSYGRGK